MSFNRSAKASFGGYFNIKGKEFLIILLKCKSLLKLLFLILLAKDLYTVYRDAKKLLIAEGILGEDEFLVF